jgi:wobble nucleotide-excising tRNase
LAGVIVGLADQGIQVFVATHSTFLLREIAILTDGRKNKNSRYFGLVASGDEDISTLEQGDTVEEIRTLVLLDEELAQSDRYMDADTNA